MSQLLVWKVCESNLHGVDLSLRRVLTTARRFPSASLIAGDATELPYRSRKFDLVIVSLVLSSILDHEVRKDLARESQRIIASGGAILVYDFAFRNPASLSKSSVRGISVGELQELFETDSLVSARATLAPPLARFAAPRFPRLASLLQACPLLRTHYVVTIRH